MATVAVQIVGMYYAPSNYQDVCIYDCLMVYAAHVSTPAARRAPPAARRRPGPGAPRRPPAAPLRDPQKWQGRLTTPHVRRPAAQPPAARVPPPGEIVCSRGLSQAWAALGANCQQRMQSSRRQTAPPARAAPPSVRTSCCRAISSASCCSSAAVAAAACSSRAASSRACAASSAPRSRSSTSTLRSSSARDVRPLSLCSPMPGPAQCRRGGASCLGAAVEGDAGSARAAAGGGGAST